MSDIQKIGTNDLIEHAAQIADAQKAAATKQAYVSDWKQFEEWARANTVTIEPATESTVVAYVVYLSRIGMKPSSIQRKLVSINQAHLEMGFKRPRGHKLRNALQGIRRLKGTARRRARPITWSILERLLKYVPDTPIGTRDRALLLLGFAGAFRRSELVAVNIEHIEFVDEGAIISQTHSKTNQEGTLRKIAIPFVDVPGMCPVKAVVELINQNRSTTGPLFYGLGSGGRRATGLHYKKRLNPATVSVIIKRYVHKAGYVSKEFSGHSLRAGFATAATQAGLSSAVIMARTGHKSYSVFQNYVRDGRLFKGHPLTSIVTYSAEKKNSSPQPGATEHL